MALTNIEVNVELDLYDHNLTPSTIKAIALDKGSRYVNALIRDRGTVYDIGADTQVVLTIIRPDKTGVQITGQPRNQEGEGSPTTVYGAYAELTQTALAIKGTLQAQFKLTNGQQILRSEIFAINNGVALDATVSEWAGEYQGYNLDELVQNVNTAVGKVDAMEQDVSELKSGLNAIEDGITQPTVGLNIFDNDFDESGYINQGVNASGSNFLRTSKYYEVADGETTLYSYHESSGSSLSCTYVFYNANKEWIENKTFNNSIVTMNLSNGVKYFRVYKHKDMTDGITIAYTPIDHYVPYGDGYELKDGSVSYEKLDADLQAKLDGAEDLSDAVTSNSAVINAITEEKIGVNIFDENFDESGYIVPTTGENASASNFKRTSAFYEIPAENDGYLYYLASVAPSNFKIIYYKSDKTYAGRSTLDNYTERAATIANEAKYYRCYTDASYSGNIMLSLVYHSTYEPYQITKEIKDNYIDYDMLKADVKEKMNTWLYGKTIVFMGDSIVGNFYDSTGICEKLANELGAEVINCAFGGSQMALRNTTNANLIRWNQLSGCKLCDAIATNDFTAQDDAVANLSGGLAYFSDRLATLKSVDWSAVDVVMWEWGVNDFQNELTVIKDTSDLTNLASYYGGYSHFIETMLTAYPHLRLVAVTPMWRYWHDGDTYLYGSDEHEVAGQLLPDFAKCAIEVANKYHIPVIDNYFGMDANKWSRTQYFGTDSVHPKEEGRTRIAKRIAHILPTLL